MSIRRWLPFILILVFSLTGSAQESKATFIAGGPYGMDKRIHDLSPAVDHERSYLVEVLEGTWQGPNGPDQGILMFVGTDASQGTQGSGTHFWVLKPEITIPDNPSATALAKVNVPGRITRIVPDAQRMLVGVEANGHAYIFDVKNFSGALNGPISLAPIYDFAVKGAWTLSNGLLYDNQALISGDRSNLAIKNIDGITMEAYMGLPLLVPRDVLLQGADVTFGEDEVAPEALSKTQVEARKSSMARPPQAATALSEYVYAMAKLQSENSGYPWLRHYYPELGKMQLSAIVDTSDPNYRQEMTSGKKEWILQADANLVSTSGVNESLPVTLLSLSAAQTSVTPLASGTSPLGELRNDGDFRYLKLMSGTNEGPTSGLGKSRFMYMPLEFGLPQAMLDRYGDRMRSDEEDQWQIRMTIRLKRKNPASGEYEEKLKLKDLSFIVKFNANTTLFDVLRGGVWYHDPNVSGNDIKKPSYNPATVTLTNSDTPLKSRLSMTPALYGGSSDQSPMVRALMEAGKSLPLSGLKLDAIQIYLDHVLNGLRREVIPPQDGKSQQQLGFLHPRPAIFRPLPEDGNIPVSQAWDALGAYAEKTANAINAIQAFTGEEMRSGSRSIADPARWQRDPGAGSGENAFIMPALSQGLMNGGHYSVEAVYFHYLIAYPGFRTTLDSRNGNNALSNLITRELVIGPSKSIPDRGRYVAPGESAPGTIYDQRKRVEDILTRIRSRKDKHDPAVPQDFADLSLAIQQQEVAVAYTSNTSTLQFNPGVGILQMALSQCWARWPKDTNPVFQESLNPQELYVADNPTDARGKINWNYDISDFNENIYKKMAAFLTGWNPPYKDNRAYLAPRIDVLINGVANTSSDLKHNLDRMQEAITAKQAGTLDYPRLNGTPLPSPVIGVYNLSKKKNQGWYEQGVWGFFDLVEATKDTLTSRNPNDKVYFTDRWDFNPDAIRLIATLKALVQVQQSVEYKLTFYGYHARQKGYPVYCWDLNIASPSAVQTLNFLVQPQEDLASKFLIAKTKDTIEEELGVNPQDPQAATLLQAAIEKAKVERVPFYREVLKGYITELERILGSQQLILHAHSQGALKAAIAHLRNGFVRKIRRNDDSTPIDVSQRIHLITYGGAANMFDWTATAAYRSFTHHVNESDFVSYLGMRAPYIYKFRGMTDLGTLKDTRDKNHSVILHSGSDAPFLPGFQTHKWDVYNCYIDVAPTSCAVPGRLEDTPRPCPERVASPFREVQDLKLKGCDSLITDSK